MNQLPTKSEYHISIRITFPDHLKEVIKKEKGRIASEYKSKYKSDPHITLYLTKDFLATYPEDAFNKLMRGLQEIKQNSFNIMLLAPKILRDAERQKNFYVLDVSYCKELEELRKQVREVAIKYQDSISSGVDNEDIKPHITVGGIDCDDTQPNLKEIENNIKSVIGKTVVVSNIVVFLYIKEDTVGKARLLEEMTIPFQP